MEAAEAVDAHGLQKGHVIQASDADQAYTQALLGDEVPGRGIVDCKVKTETWVRLPPEARPISWANSNFRDPVVPLIRALYGHPDAGGYWEAHCEKHLREVGLSQYLTGPPSSFTRPGTYSLWCMSMTLRWLDHLAIWP